MSDSRYVVGIDLGTTNCAVAFADATAEEPRIETFRVPQVVGAGEVEARATLPSFLLLPGELEVKREALALPWDADPGYAIGAFARDRGAELPHRLVASAKSWLCNPEVDLTEPILPWKEPDTEQVSPVEAAARYLRHIAAAWNAAHPDAPLAEQDVFLTVPASFDAVAREMTVMAARHAELRNATLLEEPQAAFYAWLSAAGEQWREQLAVGDVVLVCDIGGGTTDFSVIAAGDDGAGNLELTRVAVGDHILLGGDNMDLTLAHVLAHRLAEGGKQVTDRHRAALVHACRRGKETLLSADPPDKVPISVLGGGSKLIGGALRTELLRDDVEKLLVDGFFPEVGLDARPKERARMGLGELGLPYAADAGITRHLAAFLSRHDARPTAILFNGGVMQGAALRDRVAAVVSGWFGSERLPALAGTDLDLAVGTGAAYYGLVRRGRGIRIRGGLARSYYVGIESAAPAIPGFEPPTRALCVAPFGLEEGTAAAMPPDQFALVVGEPVQFRFFASTNRKDDPAGARIDVDAEVGELAPVATSLDGEPGARVTVTLRANVTEVGTLELWCNEVGGDGRWKLEYSVRDDA